MDDFYRFSSKWEGKYAVKMDFIDGNMPNATEFEKLIDYDIPKLKNGNQPQNIQDLGRVFDQEYANEAVRAFRDGDFENLPHLKHLYDTDYQVVSGQVRIKSGSISGIDVEVRPDVLFFKVDGSGNIVKSSTIWDECKIRITSPMTNNQTAIIDLLQNNIVSKGQLEFELLSNFQTLSTFNLPRGSLIGIEQINQVSISSVIAVKRIY